MKNGTLFLVVSTVVTILSGCNGFGGYPVSPSMGNDAGVPESLGDGGSPPRADSAVPSGDDAGHVARVDAGSMPVEPDLGSPCDPDRDTDVFRCQLDWCSESYMVCTGTWQCFAAGFDCHDPSRTDAGHEEPDAGTDAGTTCADGEPARCDFDCGGGVHVRGVTVCMSGSFGVCRQVPGLAECPSTGTDAGVAMSDAGVDAGTVAMADAGTDAGPVATDAGTDAGSDSGTDAGAPTRTIDIRYSVDPALLSSASTMELSEEMALMGATHADARPLTCGGSTTISGTVWFDCLVTRPIGSDFYFVGSFMTRYNATYGSTEGGVWATFSSWNPGGSSCGDAAATRGVTWAILSSDSRSLLPPSGIPEIVQPRGITEDGRRVCRGHLVF